MSHDDASGIISYDKKIDNINITWDRVGFESNFEIVNEALEKMTKGLKGTFVKNPMWSRALGKSVISAHPLGGCPMGESGRSAVVNHAGQVFNGKFIYLFIFPSIHPSIRLFVRSFVYYLFI